MKDLHFISSQLDDFNVRLNMGNTQHVLRKSVWCSFGGTQSYVAICNYLWLLLS